MLLRASQAWKALPKANWIGTKDGLHWRRMTGCAVANKRGDARIAAGEPLQLDFIV